MGGVYVEDAQQSAGDLPMTFHKGQRVTTPKGEGSVNYQRMAAPSYSQAEAVSVILDASEGIAQGASFSYEGHIFKAEDGKPCGFQDAFGMPFELCPADE